MLRLSRNQLLEIFGTIQKMREECGPMINSKGYRRSKYLIGKESGINEVLGFLDTYLNKESLGESDGIKPIDVESDGYFDVFYDGFVEGKCGSCGRWLGVPSYKDDEETKPWKYCPECGAKIDWSGIEVDWGNTEGG